MWKWPSRPPGFYRTRGETAFGPSGSGSASVRTSFATEGGADRRDPLVVKRSRLICPGSEEESGRAS
jgi:hypothetical protein